NGDILHAYALDGFILLLFLRRSLKTLLVSAGSFLCIPFLFYGLTTCYSITRQVNPQVVNRISFEDPAEHQKTIEETRRIYSRGTYAEMIEFRTRDLPRELMPGSDDSYILIGFLLGLYAGRRGIFHDVSAHLPFIRRVQGWGWMIGVVGN